MKTLNIQNKYHKALKLRATKNEKKIQEELEDILREALKEELKE